MFNTARLRACAFGVALFLGGAGAPAGLIETHVSSPYSETTDWTHTFQLPQFDTMGGTRTLLSVVVTLNATITAFAQAENLEDWDNKITLTLDSTVALDFNAEELVAPTGVSMIQTFNAGPFDGMVDFDGASGGVFNLSGSDFASTTRSVPEDLSPWIGTGLVDIVGSGVSRSTAHGPGNVVFNFTTAAAGQVTVRYEYVPAPGVWTILAASVLFITPRRRRIPA